MSIVQTTTQSPATRYPPPNNTAVQVLSSFLRYIEQCSQTYIEGTHVVNLLLFRSQSCQPRLRSESQILFVAEGEASLHFCLHSGRSFPTWLCSASPDFIAANQEARVDNVIHGEDICIDIRKLISERHSDTIPSFARRGLHSTFFTVTAILEGEPFVNGAPQNTFVPGAVEFAEREKSFIGGDELDYEPWPVFELFYTFWTTFRTNKDFSWVPPSKTDRRRAKADYEKAVQLLAETMMILDPRYRRFHFNVDGPRCPRQFLVDTSVDPLSVASYNHVGTNDGHNSSPTARSGARRSSRPASVAANCLFFKPPELNDKGTLKDKGEHPDDHVVVIKYVPAVGDSKRAINEYLPEIFCGGRSVINIFNECKDSLLATPLILDPSILAEFLTRVKYRKVGEPEFKPLHSVLSLLSYMLKVPLVKPGTEVIDSLNRQRNALEAFLKACRGLEGSSDLLLETRLW
ncbi:NAD(P)-binding protein [Coprinopsis marcescibilis]|uniref:Inositol-3-phosphate synthase n=1 Tax=Coprinopsis marcescibilis TaxID=230819 RepID=A0A5C3KGN6_COPMA|nr:NAD(P)-binding protein [Coprinopsis marcescibilis]